MESKKQFRVYAKMTEWLYVDIEALNITEAKRIASELDGGDFISYENYDWEVDNAIEL